jgi:hypothetical protein
MKKEIKIFDLPNIGDCRQSFYRKAQQIEHSNGTKALKSYNTIVCEIDKDGNFHRLWGGYSATAMRHINSFLNFNGMSKGGKKFWLAQPVEKKED